MPGHGHGLPIFCRGGEEWRGGSAGARGPALRPWDRVAWPWAQCQGFGIAEQLNMGVRCAAGPSAGNGPAPAPAFIYADRQL